MGALHILAAFTLLLAPVVRWRAKLGGRQQARRDRDPERWARPAPP